MSSNLVREHILNYSGDNLDSSNFYSNSIIEYFDYIIESDALMFHHIYIDDCLDEDKQANILDGLIDFLHDFYALNLGDKSNFNKSTITKSIKTKLKNTKLRPNFSKKEFQEYHKNKHYLKIKSGYTADFFIEEQPIVPKVIINLNTSTLNNYSNKADRELRELFQSNKWKKRKIPPKEIEEKKNLLRSFKYTLVDDAKIIDNENVSYLTLNKQSFQKNDKIKCVEGSKSFLDNIESVVFFNNYTKKDFNGFQINSLENLNKDFDTSFLGIFSIAFSTKRTQNTIWNLVQKKENIKNSITGDLKTSFQSHVILNKEYFKSSWSKMNFFGSDYNQFWNSFYEIAESYGLYELLSIKFKNIISLSLSDFIKEYILNSVFNTPNDIISADTQNSINELEEDIRGTLKNELNNLLEYIKNSGYLQHIREQISSGRENSGVIISASIANNDELRSEILNLLKVPQTHIKTWYTKNFGNRKLLVLAYRDIGNYKYHFYPNLIENGNVNIQEALLIKFFFQENYNWACYSYNISLAKVLSNPLLIDKYNWNDLLKRIYDTKPLSEKLDFDNEAYYSNSENLTEYKIKYFGHRREVRIDPHDKIIICLEEDYKILSTPAFFYDYDDAAEVEIIELSDLVRLLELQEIDFNRPEIIEQLALLKIQHNIEDIDIVENGGRLWKILLSKKREVFDNDDEFYTEVKELLNKKNVSIVSKSTFFTVWCNPESDTIRTNLKALQEICKYLEIDPSYFKLVRIFSSGTASVATKSTRIHNELVINLIDSDALTMHNRENYDLLLLQLINDFTEEFKQDLSLIGFSEANMSNSLKEVILSILEIIGREKQKVEKLTIKEPFDD